MVYWDLFAAGLSLPMDPAIPEILARYRLAMHHLTPNAMVQLSKFLWAVRTFEGSVSVDAFCRLYEMHPQGLKVTFEDEPEQACTAQSGSCTFVPRRNNKAQKIDRIEKSSCQKNKWEDDWAHYWFYAKIGFPSTDTPSGIHYPLASKILHFDHITKE